MSKLVAQFLCIAAVAACSDRVDTPARRNFIQKASHALHPSAPPLEPAEIDALLDRDDDDIIATLYADPRSRDIVFKMSLSFLGAPIDQLHVDGRWATQPFGYMPAVSAARSFRDGTDPLAELFTTKVQPSTGVVEPVRDYLLNALYPDAGYTSGTTAQRRATAGKRILKDIDDFKAFVTGLPDPFDTQKMCDAYFNANVSFVSFFALQILGAPDPVTSVSQPQELADPDSFPLDSICFNGDPATRADAIAHLDHQKSILTAMFARIESVFAMWESDPEIAFDRIDFEAIGFYSNDTGGFYGKSHLYPEFWNAAQNSSTNFNRRRGAYVLDRYFCDDLKPVGAALPTNHTEGKHASDPACAACHFKLDPMAGFFRRNGFRGNEFTDQTLSQNGGIIIFDDFATIDYNQYEAAWRAPAGSGRAFDIGYIRSTRDPSLNSYGSSIDDLDQLLHTAPEVERCFVQRMFQYFNGADQAVDPGFLDDVATTMHGAGKDRLQRGLTRILTGATFREEARNSNVCYDLAPGTDGAHRPPCEVASILRANCVSCHGGANPQSGLDLTQWEKASDGVFGFRHVVDGVAVERADTFARMKDRVMTSDLTRQMPQAKDMPLRQREQLALWLQRMIDIDAQ
jgi:hypothetical protein